MQQDTVPDWRWKDYVDGDDDDVEGRGASKFMPGDVVAEKYPGGSSMHTGHVVIVLHPDTKADHPITNAPDYPRQGPNKRVRCQDIKD